MTSDQKPKPEPTCWDCGAPNDPGSSECWLCQRRDWRFHRGVRPTDPERAARPRNPLLTIGGCMALIAVIGVAAAIYPAVAPGVAALALNLTRAGSRYHRTESPEEMATG